MRNRLIGLVLGGVLLAPAANAATMTVSDLIALSEVELDGTLSVAKFDTSLGTLTGVTWEITGAIASILGIENRGTRPISGAASTVVDFFLESAELSLGASPDFTVVGTAPVASLAVGASALFPVTGEFTLTGSETPGSAFFGPGTVDLAFSTLTSFSAAGLGGNLAFTQATDAGLMLTITYEFDEFSVVPLPGGASLLFGALGLAGLMTVRRNRAS